MNSKLLLVPTTEMSNVDWLAYRTRGIGASEVSTIMGLNPYKASIELFYEKIGEVIRVNVENIAKFLGKEQEPFLAEMWEYWDGSPEGMITNYREGKKIRRCQRVNAYVHNPDFPWLFVSLDRKINKKGTIGEGALELKTIAGYEADKWEHGIPPSHVIQVQTQLLVCMFDFGELATLKNGRDFNVLPFEPNTSIQQSILSTTKEFWDRVVAARKIVTQRFEAERNFNYKLMEELNAELVQYEPEPDGSDSFNNFLKQKYRIAAPGEMRGTEEDRLNAVAHAEARSRIKELEETKQLYENRLKNAIRDGADVMDFGDAGFVSWKANAKGSRVFLNKIKN